VGRGGEKLGGRDKGSPGNIGLKKGLKVRIAPRPTLLHHRELVGEGRGHKRIETKESFRTNRALKSQGYKISLSTTWGGE